MRYNRNSDTAMASDRRRRDNEAIRKQAIADLKDKAARLGYGLTEKCRHCGQSRIQ